MLFILSDIFFSPLSAKKIIRRISIEESFKLLNFILKLFLVSIRKTDTYIFLFLSNFIYDLQYLNFYDRIHQR